MVEQRDMWAPEEHLKPGHHVWHLWSLSTLRVSLLEHRLNREQIDVYRIGWRELFAIIAGGHMTLVEGWRACSIK